MDKKIVGVFVDVSNLYYCIGKRFETRKLDYELYLDAATKDLTLYRAFAYGTQMSDKVMSFVTCLKHIGFETRFRRGKIVPEKMIKGQLISEKMLKVEWSVGLAMDVVRTIAKLDIVILGSADASIIPLAEWVKEQGRQCIVMACGINRELKEKADRWIELDESYLEEPEQAQS